MTTLLLLMSLLASTPAQPAVRGVIETTITGTAEPLSVTLLIRNEDSTWREVSRRNLPAATRRTRFDGLPAGVYQVLLRGPGETEQLATKIIVGSDDTRPATFAVAPMELAGRVTLGGAHIGRGALTLEHKEFHWRGVISLQDDGSFRVPLWQRGRYQYSVRAPAISTSFTDAADLDDDGDPIRLAIDIPDGRITGVVRDAGSGTPVGNATVQLQATTSNGKRTMRVPTDADGRFDLVGMRDGRHTITVIAPRYLDSVPVAFDLSRASPVRELDVRLEIGRPLPVVVADANNDPIANATVLAVSSGRVCSRARTDEEGHANVSIPVGEAATLFVVPAEGGFTAVRVESEQRGQRVRLDVPAPASTLLIHARKGDGSPMPPFSLLLRFNGELMPVEVADLLEAVQGLHLGTSAGSDVVLQRIPSGDYELWPYRTEQERDDLVVAAAGYAAPIRVKVRFGENKIAVKFNAR